MGVRRLTVIGIPRTATAGAGISPSIGTTGIDVGRTVKRIATIVTTAAIKNGAVVDVVGDVRGGFAAAPTSPTSGTIARPLILWIARTAEE
jgi:hypothetical protein